MRRLYLPPEECVGPEGVEVVLERERAHRLLHVLRLARGAQLHVFDGDGHERLASLSAATRDTVTLTLGAPVEAAPEPPVSLTVCCAFPRGDRGDWLVEKAAELGARAIVPLAAARAVLEPGAGRLERWRRVAIEAAEQCGRAVVPRFLDAPPPGALGLVADLEATEGIAEALEGRALPPEGIALFVGPEGDWTPEETAAHLDAGRLLVTLGPRVLRVETAAVAALTLALAATGALALPNPDRTRR